MVKISIIVPVYNVEKYLKKCLDSLVNQTLKDIEIICINDGSTDSSLNILNEYAKNDGRIKLINQVNLGVSAARNAGLAAALGEYVMFVDSDDYLELMACEMLFDKVQKDDCDLLVFNHFQMVGNNKIIDEALESIDVKKSFQFLEAPNEFFTINTGIWGKLYKNRNLKFLDITLKKAEDTLFFWQYCLDNNPKVSILNESLYNYLQRNDGAMFNPELIKNGELFKAIAKIMGFEKFKSVSPKIQCNILIRFAQSICWELYLARNDLNIELPSTYYKKVDTFIEKIQTYDPKLSKSIIKKLKRAVRKTKYAKFDKFLQNLFSITTVPRRKVVTIAGMQIKFKYLKGQFKKEDDFIKKIKKNQKSIQQDTYLLFDCLHDSNVECVDAYSLFLYMNNIGEKVYYVLLKDSKLYKQLELENKLENIIVLENLSREYPGDFLECLYEVLLRTKCIITSFGENSNVVEKFFKKNSFWEYIFIQHGQIFLKESVMCNGYIYPYRFDKFLVSSEYETNIFKKYGFEDEELIKCGLPRWDLLKDLPKDQEKSIFVMLTWRDMGSEEFETSMYRENLLSFLNNADLINYLKENNVKLYFAPHHALAGNLGIDFKITNNYVQVVPTQNISEHIKKCSCLVTDFSSVAFDFMFQNKPVLFYLLDKGDTVLNPLEKADIENFEVKKEIISNVFYDESLLIQKLKYYVESDFLLEQENCKKYDKFFYTKENIREQLVQKIKEGMNG